MATSHAGPIGQPNAARHPRHEQMFPATTGPEILRISRFSQKMDFQDGDYLFRAGDSAAVMVVILRGQVSIAAPRLSGPCRADAEQGPGHFLAETGPLSGGRALLDARAEGPVEVLLIVPENVWALIVAEADLGERIVHALTLRTVALIENDAAGPGLIGAEEGATSPDCASFCGGTSFRIMC